MSVSLDMMGSYKFDSDVVKEKVKENEKGNYAVGISKDNVFTPKYVGRSDTNLQNELIIRLATHTYPHFKFSYATSALAAYKKECQNYHDFIKVLENENHPASPSGSNQTCHICGK